ncbi:DUF4361 domain-containing protein [Mucilaginibacter sp. BJC16-A38]|uniref:BT_3044 domain-containing protein n=1 Tax=Mucilaginibacter phenanthrenivorans TaxID=1234842 RepID=UPI002158157B|nr:DUF4361 domain-containing protein [Mucilaginibacter phenanthrenivorans]MCR8557826.1 DUF4361 domain-containing protein [Mucilaginibacter phenanthrenivorans]
MKTKILQYLALACLLITVFSSCRKESFGGKENSQAGKTYVWITEAPELDQHFDVFTDIKLVTMFTIRRDPANKADLQKAVTVTIKSLGQDQLDVLTDTAGYTDLFPLSNLYTMPTAANIASGGIFTGTGGITKTATGFTVNFAAGEFAKSIIFFIDGSKLDLTKKYGSAFQITNFGGFTTKTGYGAIVATVGIKNKYDGVYHADGTFTRYSAPGVFLDSRTINQDKTLGTVDANTVSSTVADLGSGDPLNLTVNADNTVTVTFVGTSLSNLPAPYTQVGDNHYDPATKTFTLSYQYRGQLRTTTETLKLNQ